MPTNQEYVLTDEDLIVSKTDLRGTITFINDDFVRIGGYSRQELLGSPHNILRHPDMPKAAFADMWKTLRSGNAWTGIVKNRQKDGGFYWVRANAMPIWENSQIIGYMSVRDKASLEEIKAAETLYRDLNAGRSSVKLSAGEIIPPSLVYAIRRKSRNISIKAKLLSLVFMAILSLVGVGTYGVYGLKIIKNAIEIKIEEVDTHAKCLTVSRSAELEFKTQIQEWKNILLRGQDAAEFEKYSKAFDKKGEIVISQLHDLETLMADMPEKEVVALIGNAISIHNEIMTKYHAALKTYQVGNPASVFVVDAAVKGIDREFIAKVNGLVDFHQKEIEKHFGEEKLISSNVVHQFQIYVALFSFAISLILLGWSILTLSSVLHPITKISKLIKDITDGKKVNVDEFSENEFGTIIRAIKSMAFKSSFEVSEQRILANEVSRIKMALDEVTMPVTLSNAHRELVYMNKASIELWKEMESEIGDRIPDFTVETMLGHSMAEFLESDRDKAFFAKIEKKPVLCDLKFGGKNIRATIVAIYDERDVYIGRAVQWMDRTAELALEKQISMIVAAATAGDFSGRLATQNEEGFFTQLAQSLNLLLETCEKSYGDIARIFDAFSHGDLTQTITSEYRGEFNNIKNNANNTVYKLTEIVDSIKSITQNVSDSSKEIAANNLDLSGRTNSQTSAIEETASSMQKLTSMVEANTENANHANSFVIGTSNTATKGVNVIRRVVSTMEDIRESSRKVVDIISVIDSISFQTNILALNAAVEAARAGEQGRGFAVVATEVRSLAQRAAAAAGEIKILINESVEKIEDGSKLVVDAGHTMEDIVGSIHTVTDMIGQISVASSEQNAGIGLANNAILEMEEMTQQNAILVGQSSATAEHLKDQAAELSKAVDYFKIR